MQSSKFIGFFLSIFIESYNIGISAALGTYVLNIYNNFKRDFGFIVKVFPKISLAHSIQCKVYSGNNFNVQCGIYPSYPGSALLP